MKNTIQIDSSFIESQTDFVELIKALEIGFVENSVIVPLRHHHDFPNPEVQSESTLLLMPAWNPNHNAGVKIVTVSPENSSFGLSSIQGTYIYLDAKTGTLKAIMDAKALTAKRTAAASALASSYLSREDSSSLLMIGTGELSINLIKAHSSVRPIKKVYIWGRQFDKAKAIANQLNSTSLSVIAIETIEEKIGMVDIISCATLSKTPLIHGDLLNLGQHIDLVGAYKKDMRESDDSTILRASVFVDTFEAGMKESGDIAIPLKNGILSPEEIKADLFSLASKQHQGRSNASEITVFKSVGHALEDLVAATFYYKKYMDE